MDVGIGLESFPAERGTMAHGTSLLWYKQDTFSGDYV